MVTITPKQYLIWTSLLKGEPGKIPGNVLAMDTKKPFTQLKQFGGSFLTRYQKYKSSQTSNFIFQIWVFYCKVFCSWESLHAWHTRYITCLNSQNKVLAKNWWFRAYFRYPGWREADSEQRIWLHCCLEVVCWEGWQDHSSLWCTQTWHLWWIQDCRRVHQGPWW